MAQLFKSKGSGASLEKTDTLANLTEGMDSKMAKHNLLNTSSAGTVNQAGAILQHENNGSTEQEPNLPIGVEFNALKGELNKKEIRTKRKKPPTRDLLTPIS